MQELYTTGTIVIGEETFDLEADFQWDTDGPYITEVRAVKIIKPKHPNDVWYDREGNAHKGRRVIMREITDFVDLPALAQEISSYYQRLWGGQVRVAA